MRRALPLVFSFLFPACHGGSTSATQPVCTTCGPCEESVAVTSYAHVSTPIDYPDPPPVGGDHAPCWTTWGVHTTEVPDENWVHNLEHGGVVVLYDCPSGCDAEIAAIEALVPGRPFLVTTPYAALPARFGIVSWGHRLVSDCYDPAAFEAFYDAHVDQARESSTAEPPAVCVP